jgi:hypothetical protein
MSPTFGVILMMNNYFHDVATALLLSSGAALWVILRRLGVTSDEAVLRYFLALHGDLSRLAKASLLWIVLGGIPRTIFYADFEWANAAGKGQVPALMVKHALFFIFVGAGAHLWGKINKKTKSIKERLK